MCQLSMPLVYMCEYCFSFATRGTEPSYARITYAENTAGMPYLLKLFGHMGQRPASTS